MRYGPGLEALSNVSFEITRGELVFLAGHSGAGKSTVLRLVLALETCSGGNLFVAGKRIKGLSKFDLAMHRRQIGAVFQDHQLLFDRSVGDNVALPCKLLSFPTRVKRRVELRWIKSDFCTRKPIHRLICRAENSSGWASPEQSSTDHA